MALPKRNRRNTKIDDRHFHWAKGSRGDNGRGVVTVQAASGSGAKLMIDPYGQIRDDDIPGAIRFALDAGWIPDESGPAMWIGFEDHSDPQSRFTLRAATDRPYWCDRKRHDSLTSGTEDGEP